MALYYDLPVFKDVYKLILLIYSLIKDFSKEYKYTYVHYKTNRLRKRTPFKHLNCYWLNHVYLSGRIAKFVLKISPLRKENVG